LIAEGKHDEFWQGVEESRSVPLSVELKDLLSRMFSLMPENRLSIEQIKNHPWFKKKAPNMHQVKNELLAIRNSPRFGQND